MGGISEPHHEGGNRRGALCTCRSSPILVWQRLALFKGLPVLLLPAKDSLQLNGRYSNDLACSLETPSCQQAVLGQQGKPYGPKLQLAYASTLSSNASLIVVDGKHDYPQVDAGKVAHLLEAKFRGCLALPRVASIDEKDR